MRAEEVEQDYSYDGLESAVPTGEADDCGCPIKRGLPEHKADWGRYFPRGEWTSHHENCPWIAGMKETMPDA